MESGLFVLLVLSFALFSMNLVLNLIFLILLILLYLTYMFFTGAPMFAGILMLMVFLTGLFVVFSYIASTSPFDESEEDGSFGPTPCLFFFSTLTFFLTKKKNFFLNFFLPFYDWSFSGLVLMTLLIFFVIFFVRATYSKGGAMRRKF